MPRPTMLPTPVSSTEIKGQDSTQKLSQLPQLQMSFELPPSAIGNKESAKPANSETTTPVMEPNSQVSYPVQASEAVKSRRRPSAVRKETFALPPPPTRARKIIQMKPRQDEAAEVSTAAKETPKGAGGAPASATKKKQSAATSAAGRRMARKTAHSLIERRRRSKMNEEFGVLKSLIPACTGEMHKLAILQASIDYVRYLEDCVSKLKAQCGPQSSASTPTQFILPPPASRDTCDEEQEDCEDDEDGGDVEMTESEAPSPTFTAVTARSHQLSESPLLIGQDSHHRQYSHSSASSDPRHYSYSAPSVISPALDAQNQIYPTGPASGSNSTLTSPALAPQRDVDHEASAALLMLNSDRRATQGSGPSRGMSVRDLLSA